MSTVAERFKKLSKKVQEDQEFRSKRDEELLSVKITKADVDELMKTMGIPDSEKASRILRQVGGKVPDAVRFCIFDFPEIAK